MAALARWQATIVDGLGNAQPGASVEVRKEAGGALAALFSDRAGAVGISNPFTADGNGFAAFHVVGGAFQIVATLGAFSRTWRYVPVSTSAEQDKELFTLTASSTTSLTPGSGSNAFTLLAPAGFVIGMRLRASSAANPTTKFMEGVVTAYDGALALTITVEDFAGTAAADWNLAPVGKKGDAGAGVVGLHSIWVPATAMIPRITNGAALGSVEMATNKNMLKTLDFDPTTQEFAQFHIRMPKSWDESTLTFQALWSHPATATNFGVAWALEAVAVSDDDALDVAFGTAQQVTDTGGTTNDLYHSPKSSAITVGGTPVAEDLVQFQVKRVPADGADTLAVDARLHGVLVFYTVDQGTDV
jgi:hypothetical protein